MHFKDLFTEIPISTECCGETENKMGHVTGCMARGALQP